MEGIEKPEGSAAIEVRRTFARTNPIRSMQMTAAPMPGGHVRICQNEPNLGLPAPDGTQFTVPCHAECIFSVDLMVQRAATVIL